MLRIKWKALDEIIYIWENNQWVCYNYNFIYTLEGSKYVLLHCHKSISFGIFNFTNKNFNFHEAYIDMDQYMSQEINFPFKSKKRETYITLIREKNGYDSAFDYNETINFFESYKLAKKLIGG